MRRVKCRHSRKSRAVLSPRLLWRETLFSVGAPSCRQYMLKESTTGGDATEPLRFAALFKGENGEPGMSSSRSKHNRVAIMINDPIINTPSMVVRHQSQINAPSASGGVRVSGIEARRGVGIKMGARPERAELRGGPGAAPARDERRKRSCAVISAAIALISISLMRNGQAAVTTWRALRARATSRPRHYSAAYVFAADGRVSPKK